MAFYIQNKFKEIYFHATQWLRENQFLLGFNDTEHNVKPG